MKDSRISLFFFVTTLLLFSFGSGTFAAPTEASNNKIIYNAFINRDMHKWEALIRTLENSNELNSVGMKLDLINYYYGDIGYLLGIKQYDRAETLIEKGEKLIKEVLRQSPDNATAYSFKGSYLGFRIGINHYKAIFLESDSKAYVNKALKLDAGNVQALIDKGNMLYYAPHLLGGDKEKALDYFLKAAYLLEKNKETYQNWVYLNLLTIIASAYEKTGNMKQAELTYEKILRIEPNITWVRDDLYPKFRTRLKG